MAWIQVIMIIGLLGGINFFIMLHLSSEIKGLSAKIDAINRRMDGHAGRIDQLYVMFVDLLKDGKTK